MSSKEQQQNITYEDDEIDLLALFGRLWSGRWLIVAVTLIFAAFGILYGFSQENVYRAQALIQIEGQEASLPGMDDLKGVFEQGSKADTEIELILSRRVLEQVVRELGLDVAISPNYFPVIGQFFAGFQSSEAGETGTVKPLFRELGAQYAWGGEDVGIDVFKTPLEEKGQPLLLRATESGWQLERSPGSVIMSGVVGKDAEADGYELVVSRLKASTGTTFNLTKRRTYDSVAALRGQISVTEKGRETGILELTFDHVDPQHAEGVLNSVAQNYLEQNVGRNSAEAKSSLEFLREGLPAVRKELEAAEAKLNSYRIGASSVDVTAEARILLEQIVELEKRISDLEMQRSELTQRFERTHPRFQAWKARMVELTERRNKLEAQVGQLPKTQRDLVSLQRNVKVSNEIYLQMLSRIQQLELLQAGTVGNVRIIDSAATDISNPVSPKRQLIFVLSVLLGGMVGIFLVLVRTLFNRGVDDPEIIESSGTSVYAVVPYSREQNKARKYRNRSISPEDGQLPTGIYSRDIALEALRSLRTGLHFRTLSKTNNIVMIAGPSPGIGKTFVSCNLATVIAQTGKKVLLIDADLRLGSVHTYFDFENESGLSEFLSRRCSEHDVIRKSQLETLDIIGRGASATNPSELLLGNEFKGLLYSVSKQYDVVIVDTPPVLAVTDPSIIGNYVGTILLLAYFERTPLRELNAAKKRLELAGCVVDGVVLNGVERKFSAYGNYSYYAYEYGS